ncbi:OadG family protein [Fulvivirgaceae bacterium BMA10]|uniref:OadG family protein n=1 Tax=Splendidivirga corallicola TaxID=3051826 RepID=A0ABT8KLC3_9BACT|nr:OadG family protein [Fulvivirgaceae bacterium BMA10]
MKASSIRKALMGITTVIVFLAALFGFLSDGISFIDRIFEDRKTDSKAKEEPINTPLNVKKELQGTIEEFTNTPANIEEELPGTIEILDLINLFVASEDEDFDVGEWDIGTDITSSILWSSEGLEWNAVDSGIDASNLIEPRPSFRKGKVHINMDGEPSSYVLGREKKPIVWDIYLYGERELGYFYVHLVNSTCTSRIRYFSGYLMQKKLIKEIKDYKHYNRFDDESPAGIWGYSFKVKGREISFLEEYVCEGNCGCLNELLFKYDGSPFPKQKSFIPKENI